MKREKARLTQLASKMRLSSPGTKNTGTRESKGVSDFGKTEIRQAEIRSVEANPPHGERGDFRKVTVTLPPDVFGLLVQESARRKIAGEPNHLLASIIREAVVSHLRQKGKPR